MGIPVWFGLIVAIATLAGLFVGYFHKSEDFGRQMTACVLGMIAWIALIFFLPHSERPVLVAFSGQVTWVTLVTLGVYLGAKHRQYHDCSGTCTTPVR